MTSMNIQFKPAESEQADAIAEIITETSGGIVDYLLSNLVPGFTPAELLCSAVLSEDNAYCYENVIMAMEDEHHIGLMLAYPGDKHTLPGAARNFLFKRRLDLLKDILMSQDHDSLHINTLWVRNDFRGTGIADSFIELASLMASDYELPRLSLHVWADNQRAIRFYKRHGFIQNKHIPVNHHPLLPHQGGKLLMLKELE